MVNSYTTPRRRICTGASRPPVRAENHSWQEFSEPPGSTRNDLQARSVRLAGPTQAATPARAKGRSYSVPWGTRRFKPLLSAVQRGRSTGIPPTSAPSARLSASLPTPSSRSRGGPTTANRPQIRRRPPDLVVNPVLVPVRVLTHGPFATASSPGPCPRGHLACAILSPESVVRDRATGVTDAP